MATDPVNTGFALLTSTLKGDATFMALVTGGVWQVLAPPTTLPDFCLLINQSAADTNAGTGGRLLTRALFQVKIVGPVADAANLRAAYARADGLLQPNGQPLRNSGGVLACYREQALSYGEVRGDGTLWLHYGGLYRLEV